jgi:hypothetical protein
MIRFLPASLSAICLFASVATNQVSEYSLRVCERSASDRLAGGRFKVSLPKGAITKDLDGVDYQNYFVGFGKGKKRVWMLHGFGPNWSSGDPPKPWIEELTSVERRTWRFKGNNDQGVDIRGKTSDGKYTRFFGAFGETIKYHEVPQEAAIYFDKIIDSVCYQQQGV